MRDARIQNGIQIMIVNAKEPLILFAAKLMLGTTVCALGLGRVPSSHAGWQESDGRPEIPAEIRQLSTQQPTPNRAETVSNTVTEATARFSDQNIIVDNAVLKIVEERNVPARTRGVIQITNIREGSLVHAGDLLMTIDQTQPLIELKKARHELEMATLEADSKVDLIYVERSIEVAQAELERAQRSNQRRPGVVAQSELDQLGLVVSRSLAEKEKTEFQMQMRGMLKQVREVAVELNQHQIELCQIPAPMTGMIVDVFRREGEWVDASEAVARMVRLDVLRAEIKLPAAQALDDLVGASATFHPKLVSPSLEKTYSGKVVFVYPEANPISADVRVWIEIENRDLKLIPGLLGRMEVNPPGTKNPSTVITSSPPTDK